MKKPFRHHHLLSLLDGYQEQSAPIDVFMSHYFRDHKSLGSKDRAFIAETTYSLMRWRGLLDWYSENPYSWEKRFAIYQEKDLFEAAKKEDIPPHIRVSFPKTLYQWIEEAYGTEKAQELCLSSNQPAPITVRVNRIKTDREKLLATWKDHYDVFRCQKSPEGITFSKRINFFTLPEFKQGLFEVQDEASQLVAACVKASPGDKILDWCAGAGGKALAIAPPMQGKGQIYLHDIRPWALQDAKKRLRRAGIQNAQILLPDAPHQNKLKKHFDWVLVDAPCSGTGTLRRNPDMKWKINEETLNRLEGQQRQIFEKALSFLKPNGKIIYATCSILPRENQQQMEHFLKTYDLSLVDKPFQSFPKPKEMDGFFAATFTTK